MSATPRRLALADIASIQPLDTSESQPEGSLTEFFACDVFDDRAMREFLPATAYEALKRTIESGQELDPDVADVVANGMKEWAVERGATHFTHWFQPMTGSTAEKHDAFLHFSGGQLMLDFSGKELIKGEPDASSFPSGGIRSTFEARGYTAWDPTSPAFLRQEPNGSTLCIPTAFCSWTGEALDKKTPLLRSMEALNSQAVRLLRLLGEDVEAVYSTVGVEQEFFLIDRNFFLQRPDLIATGRTLVGARPPKGQELEDHYFGAISPRMLAFLQDAEYALWRLGVPIKTRHNEVAPSQYEMAPVFERCAVATDHNMVTMDVLRNVARRHGLVCLLHEKPFAGINGSGKHNNWSLSTNSGENLLDPGHTPAENARFMVVLSAVIRAVHEYADLLRISVSRAGNDHRLGANEAPPAIMSIYLGDELDGVVKSLISGSPAAAAERTQMRLGVSALPPLPRDTTDRNRTSPFAFTGNKFEFRAVGSSQSVATPNYVLNTAVAESLMLIADRIEGFTSAGESWESAAQKVVQETLAAHHAIIFNGNNYSSEWIAEAESRGLPNWTSTPEAIGHLCDEKNVRLFERMGVLSRRELAARLTIMRESYSKAVAIEAQCMLSIAGNCVLPAAIRYQERTSQALCAARTANGRMDLTPQVDLLSALVGQVNELMLALRELQNSTETIESAGEQPEDNTSAWHERVLPSMERTRIACDRLETIVDDDLWPLPKYREMLFIH